MIEYIRGTLSELNPAYAVIEAAGVGYAVNIALPTYSALAAEQGKEVLLYIHEVIREDTHDLFGFRDRGERELFLLLMTVQGIGANTARMILSAYTASEIRQIVATGNAKALSQVKGLGLKTAQRIIVDLKDKVLKIQIGSDPTNNTLFVEEPTTASQNKDEAVQALTMLGFAPAPTTKAVDKILKEDPTASVEHIIRLALKML